MYLVNSPVWLQWLYPSLTWHKSRQEKCVYLTFDDGPIPVVTPFVLNTLKNFEAKATFFCIGDNVVRYPEIYQELISQGHSVGNHTFNHLNGWKTATGTYLQNIEKAAGVISSDLFRPPYGRIKKSQIAGLKSRKPHLKTIMWDVLSGDFDLNLTPQECVQNVISNARNGSIIVFHDSLKAFPRLETALPEILQNLKEKGYRFLSL